MGARVAAEMASVNKSDFILGVFCLSYPLHRPQQYTSLRTSHLLQLLVPLLIINGTKDPMCQVDLMENQIQSLACAISMHWIKDADHSLSTKNGTHNKELSTKIGKVISDWCQSILCLERT